MLFESDLVKKKKNAKEIPNSLTTEYIELLLGSLYS